MAQNRVEPLQREIALFGRRQLVRFLQALNFGDISTVQGNETTPAKEQEEFLRFRDGQDPGIRQTHDDPENRLAVIGEIDLDRRAAIGCSQFTPRSRVGAERSERSVQRNQEIVGRRGQDVIEFGLDLGGDHRSSVDDAVHQGNRASFVELPIRLPAIAEENTAVYEVGQRLDKRVDAGINSKPRCSVF